MTIERRVTLGVALACFVSAGALSNAQNAQETGQVPRHPRDLKFQPLTYDPPERAKYRNELAGGVVAYMVEDHDLPLIQVTVSMRAGAYLEPQGKTGLAAATGSLIRGGGAGSMTAEQFDEEVAFLAANMSSNLGGATGAASANFLAKDTDKALDLFFQMLRSPVFQQDRLDLYKVQQLQQMERRNDDTEDIEAREWNRLTRGTDHFSSTDTTKASIESLTRADLQAFHRQFVHPANFVLAVSGDFKTADMKARLEKAMAGWAKGEKSAAVPPPKFTPAPGLYLVNKADVNQGRVSIGHLGIQRGNPDEIAIDLMNDILGGSGFTSRITNRVRSDEGLAYSAGSAFNAGAFYPGLFRASFQSKNPSVARALQIVVDEINRIRSEPVSAEELDTVKTSAIEVFPRFFASANAIAGTFATDELTGRDPNFWKTYRDRVRAVTVEDIRRVAQQYLKPDALVILAVGNVDEMLKGDPDRPDFSLEKLAQGKITRIPLPDPLTLQYPR